jgi:hypothetical protein
MAERLGDPRADDADSAIRLARRFREMAGFSTEEIDEIARMASADRNPGPAPDTEPALTGPY